MNFTLFTAVFLCMGWIVEIAGNERPPDCCITVTNTRIPVDNIVDYNIQEPPLCSIKAVRFNTKKNKVICSDPNSDWAKNVIVKLSPSTKPIQCKTKTIQTTTHKTPGTHTETSMSINVQPTVTVINTSGPETSTSTTKTTSEAETSTITTSRPKTRSTTMKTIKSSQLETESSKRSTKKTETPPQTSFNTVTTCGTDEPMTPRQTPDNRVTSTTPAKRTKPSRLKLKAKKKSKKEFRKLQMGIKPRNKSE